MARLSCSAAIVILVICAAACNGGGPGAGPTTPSDPTTPGQMGRPANGEAFEVTGIVTDDQGVPMAGAEVTMAHSLGGMFHRPSVRTDAAGRYTIAFTSNPWTNGLTGSRGAARAEVVVAGFDWYWRTVVATSPRLVEDFRLHRIKRVTAGGSIALSVSPDIGECTGWLYGPCGRLRVVAPAGGNLTVEAVPTQEPAGLPQIQVCCVGGDERYGNPVTLRVNAGEEMWVEVGQQRPGLITSGSFTVKTSIQPF
jgi:hypothetical protein